MTDLLTRLTAARPGEDELERLWPAERHEAVRARVAAPPPVSRLRRRTTLAAAGALLATGVAVPAMWPTAAAADDLRALAAVAARGEGPVLSPGSWLHVRTESVQRNSRLFGDGATLETDRESWVRWDGEQLVTNRRDAAGWTDYQVFEAPAVGSFGSPTPEFLAGLPTDPVALRAYLDEHVSGSNSHDEAIFVAVTDMAHSHLLPPDLLAAALEVLAGVDGVSSRDVTVDGVPAVEVTFTPYWFDFVAAYRIVIAKDTAQVLSVSDSDPGGTYTSATTLSQVVSSVPEQVRADFDRYGDGQRVWDPGVTPDE